MKHVAWNSRIPIKAEVRNQVWRKRHDSLIGECHVCEQSLESHNFQCGHIVSVFYGGETVLSNLEPICASCNNDMGINSLDVYRDELQRELEE